MLQRLRFETVFFRNLSLKRDVRSKSESSILLRAQLLMKGTKDFKLLHCKLFVFFIWNFSANQVFFKSFVYLRHLKAHSSATVTMHWLNQFESPRQEMHCLIAGLEMQSYEVSKTPTSRTGVNHNVPLQ